MERNEAIKIVKSNWPEGREQLSEALETLIPEFRKTEDEKVADEIIDFIHYNGGGYPFGSKEKWKSWINDRRKSTWTEEDDRIMASIVSDTVQEVPLDDEQINWIKSFKARKCWKPTNEQLGSLASACNGHILNLDYLNSLYNDLKKL